MSTIVTNHDGSNQNVSNSNSKEHLLYSNDKSINSNHVVISVNKSIVCNEIETNAANANCI